MKKTSRTILAFVVAFAISLFPLCATGVPAFADVGSVANDEDVTYDKDGGLLESIGIDTSKMPEDYDPTSTDNPYGSDVMNMNPVHEFFEITPFDTPAHTGLYGHNVALDGKYDTFANTDAKYSTLDFLDANSYASLAACDLKGVGREQSIAIVYTNHTAQDENIYLRVYDPLSGTASEPIEISTLSTTFVQQPFIAQSQMQITCGDYDNDTVDEIAVYVPAPDENTRPKVSIFDLVNGTETVNPYDKNAWHMTWNYVLPAMTVPIANGYQSGKLWNFYNNIDLVSGDADNDGTDDLVISFGASSTDAEYYSSSGYNYSQVKRSLPSRSVLLYGSDKGQMLKDSQWLSYGKDDLIRVSFAFGDLDGDGNEEMLLGGQLRSEQDLNVSRVLGKYTYDEDSRTMIPEVVQNMYVVEGKTDDDGNFESSNGWDENYYSTPVMKTNMTVGSFFGSQSNTRIYLDSVLYSYDTVFSIEDELEDKSTELNSKGDEVPKGSRRLTDIEGKGDDDGKQWEYFEYGAQSANYTGGEYDYFAICRVSKPKRPTEQSQKAMEAIESLLYVDKYISNDETVEEPKVASTYSYYDDTFRGSGFFFASPDTDIDGTVLEYTGNHKVTYDKPKVLAVLTSAPYFKDVAAYDNGAMLKQCTTAFGSVSGDSNGYQSTITAEVGFVGGYDVMPTGFFINGGAGVRMTASWGHNTTRTFTVTYNTAGGEDAVVLYSTPTENFEYKVKGVTVDSKGKLKEYEDTVMVLCPHRPVTQTLTLEDYMDIYNAQPEESNVLPKVTEYFKSTPGDPSSYPKSKNDIPQAAKDKLAKDVDGKEKLLHDPAEDDWAGVAFGSGKVTQSYSITTNTTTNEKGANIMAGAYINVDVGATWGNANVYKAKAGLHVSFSGMGGKTAASAEGTQFTCTVANMPRSAKDYGYFFAWKMLAYTVNHTKDYTFSIVTYTVDNVQCPPSLPDDIVQDFDNTTDSQTALTWTYNADNLLGFDVYKYYDFPQGGGDLLVGTVGANEYQIVKDAEGNTVTDKNGRIMHRYTFIDKDLTADTKYQYRIKTKRRTFPNESIFSPIITARTDVSQKPDVSISSNDLKIYPDGIYRLSAVVADSGSYEGNINYQWQKYDDAAREWADVTDCMTRTISFYNCDTPDEGTYRCRVNLVRKVESHPQYISVYTDSCKVSFSKRSVVFGDIDVFKSKGSAPSNTGISVTLTNSSAASLEKPTGEVKFTIEGANAIFYATTQIDEATGVAKISSLEELMRPLDREDFCDGGYKVTASYGGSKIFDPADDPEEYHYLRNIGEALWLSARSTYIYGEDLMESVKLYDYKKNDYGAIIRTDVTDQITSLKIYQAKEDGSKKDDVVAEYALSGAGKTAILPLDSNLVGTDRAFIEVFTDSDEPAGSAKIAIEKRITTLALRDKMTGVSSIELFSLDDVTLSGDGTLEEENIVTGNEMKSLADLIKFRYYEDSEDFMFDSENVDTSQFIPAEYRVRIQVPETLGNFYELTSDPAELTIVGNYYRVSAVSSDENAGTVGMASPDAQGEYATTGYAGGTKLVFKAQPNKGFHVKGWKVDECGENEYTLPASSTLTYTVKSNTTSGSGEIKITALFEAKNNILAFGAKGQGSIDVSPHIASGSTVVAGTSLKFTAVPDDGWRFEEWRWTEAEGGNSVARGTMAEDGTNTKTFNMADSSVSLYGVFMRDTIDIDLSKHLVASYINNGGNPLEEIGAEVACDEGQDVPKGSQVIVKTKEGYKLADGAEWNVTITTSDETYQANVEEVSFEGREGCKFTLPDEATACSVSVDTEKGKYSLSASSETDDVSFVIKVDGVKKKGTEISGIEAGSQVEITAVPDRGKTVESWKVNGKKTESTETVYMTIIKQNLSVVVATAADEAVSLKLKTEGGGSAKYVITDKNGVEHTDTFGADEVTPDLYKGESLTVSQAEEASLYTMTAVSVNGRNQPVDDQTFTLKEVESAADIICRFTPNTYCNVKINKQMRDSDTVVTDAEDVALADGDIIKVVPGGTATVKVHAKNGRTPSVLQEGKQLDVDEVQQSTIEGMTLYVFKLSNIEKSTELTVRDFSTTEISNFDELKGYFDDINTSGASTVYSDAVLTNDIEVPTNGILVGCNATYCGVFDGQGHTIKGLNVGSADNPAAGGLFAQIGDTGSIKDVVFENCTAYLQANTANPHGFITDVNNGTITSVAMIGTHIISTDADAPDFSVAGLAAVNEGTIAHCLARGLEIEAANPDSAVAATGCSGVICNQKLENGHAVMEDNYFEDIVTRSQGGLQAAESSIIASEGTGSTGSNGQFKGNFYKTTYAAADANGINVFTKTSNPDDRAAAEAEAQTAQFMRMMAYIMNENCGEKLWGITSNDETETSFIQIVNGGKNCKAPVKADFRTAETLTWYLYPGEHALPGAGELGDATPVVWVHEDRAYSPGYPSFAFNEDVELFAKGDTSGYVASVSYDGGAAVYFEKLNDAFSMATVHNAGDIQHLNIIGECAMENKAFTIDSATVMTLLDGSVFTMDDKSEITNKGSLVCAAGSTMHKYGFIYNSGTVDIEGTFYNYGTKFTNKGEITNRDKIICKPHCTDKWTLADEPNDDGTWSKTAECEACGHVEKLINPDPEAEDVANISVKSAPTKDSYVIGDEFTDEGLLVVAELTDGDKAVVKSYKLSVGGQEISNGTVLENVGDFEVAASYEGFSCTFKIAVREPVTPIDDAEVVLSATSFTYNGKVQMPAVKTVGGMELAQDVDYTASVVDSKGNEIASPTDAGSYALAITGKGAYAGATKANFTIEKAANTLKVKGKTAKLKSKKLKKKAQKLAASKAFKFTNKGEGKVTYKLVSVKKVKKKPATKKAKKKKKNKKKRFKINKTTGKIAAKKGLKKGIYKVKVKVVAAGDANYLPSGEQIVVFKVKVK